MVEQEERSTVDGPDAGGSADWPYASLLLVGTFGTRTPAARTYWRRSMVGIVLAIVSLLGTGDFILNRLADWVWAITFPGAVALILWANMRYLGSLDELSRSIQLKSYAFSYGVVMVLAAAGVGIAGALTEGRGYPTVDAGVFFVWLLLAEGIRGIALVVHARRYR